MVFLNEYIIKEFLESKKIFNVFANFARELQTDTFEMFFLLSSKNIYSLAFVINELNNVLLDVKFFKVLNLTIPLEFMC